MQTAVLDEVGLSEKEFRLISGLVYKHCGINLHDGKKELVRARLAKRLRLCGFTSFAEYINYVLKDTSGSEFSSLVDCLSTNLTSFFREAQHFDFLRTTLLPQLMERKRRRQSCRLRAWSAGCSSGEEPYTIAIVLLEAVEGQGRWDTKVLATDISTAILEKAKQGLYDEQRIAPLSAMQRASFLTARRAAGRKVFEVSDRLRSTVVFRYLNLMADWPVKGPLDFIFCRNVMIYFDKPTQQRLISRYYDLLDSGGVLFTGHSESLTGIDHAFKYIQPTIYMKP
ncbi:MAG: protein-glutamate O-methyltransferase [Phycisphaerae bacterium]|nr:protein-glutamate O-methyltransferase [Phycisphaerae bacterium]